MAAHKKRSTSIVALVIALAVLLLLAVLGIFSMATMNHEAEEARENQEAMQTNVEIDSVADAPMDNPIDFVALKERIPDAYAWLRMPGTNIDLPILLHPTDDDFYLDHDESGNENFVGALFTQLVNSDDFSDPVTVIYGHNLPRYGLMFTELHNYERADFFDQNDAFYIYLPDKILEYRVIAVYEYDNRHIVNSFDFSDNDVLQGYFDGILGNEASAFNIRKDTELNAKNDRIVQLSTCTNPSNSEKRFIVTGLLINETPAT